MPTTVTHQHRTEAQRIGWGGVVFFALLMVGVLDARFLPPAFRVQMVFLALCGAVAWAGCFFFLLPAFFVPAPPARPSTSAPPRILKMVERDSPAPPPVVAVPVDGSQLDVLLPQELRDVFVKPFTTLPPLTEFPDASYDGFFEEMRKDGQRRSIVKTLTLSRQVKEEAAAGLKLARGASDDFYHTIENYLKASELEEDQKLRQKQREADIAKIDREMSLAKREEKDRRVNRLREQQDRRRQRLVDDARTEFEIARFNRDTAKLNELPAPTLTAAERASQEQEERIEQEVLEIAGQVRSILGLKREEKKMLATTESEYHRLVSKLFRRLIEDRMEEDLDESMEEEGYEEEDAD